MKRGRPWSCTLLSAFLLLNACASFTEIFDEVYSIDITEADIQGTVPSLPAPSPIVVGCQLADCGPGTAGPGPIDLHIRLTGALVESVTLEFENLTPRATQQIAITGNAKLLPDSRFKIGQGVTILSGFVPHVQLGKEPSTGSPPEEAIAIISSSTPPVATARLAIAHAAVEKLLGQAALEAQQRIRTVELVVEQMRGPVVVNEFHVQYQFPILFQRKDSSDHVRLLNQASANKAVLLVSGRRATGCVWFEKASGLGSVDFPNLLSTGTSCTAEVVAFSADDAMKIVTLQDWTNQGGDWTDDSGDVRSVDLSQRLLRVPVSLWILRSDKPFDDIKKQAIAQFNLANILYNRGYVKSSQKKNYCGIEFVANGTDYHDSSEIGKKESTTSIDGEPKKYSAMTCDDGHMLQDLQTEFTFSKDKLNVYYVDSLGPVRGGYCGGNVILIPKRPTIETLAHEFGHALSLEHFLPNQAKGLGLSMNNVMVTGGSKRTKLTKGQCFRCNFNKSSFVKQKNIRAADLGDAQSCDNEIGSDQCPHVTKN